MYEILYMEIEKMKNVKKLVLILLAVLVMGELTGCVINTIREEKERAEGEREEARRVRPGDRAGPALVDWEKAFPTREEAAAWLDDILERFDYATDIVRRRRNVYSDKAGSFRRTQSSTNLDDLIAAKNNLIEAFNRYEPIATEAARVLAAGATLRDFFGGNDDHEPLKVYKGDTGLSYIFYPLREGEIKKAIDYYTDAVEKLIDAYPIISD
jgi:hypothetical protein